MTEPTIRFNDGAAYEQMMGVWSAKAGAVFLDWLKPPQGLRWIDVGCGNGAFTALLAERTAPAEVQGVDPSDAQLAFARARPGQAKAEFRIGDAMSLPFPDARFDAAVMALVIVFLADPAKGVAEMARVVKEGGLVAAYMWDMLGGGFPFNQMLVEMRAMEISGLKPPQIESSRLEAMKALWRGAGLAAIATCEIAVERTFADFDDYWTTAIKASTLGPLIMGLAPGVGETLKARVRAGLGAEAGGRIIIHARAHAISGQRN